MFENMFLFFLFLDKPRVYTGQTYCQTYFTTPMLQISDFGRSDQYCHHRSKNFIIISRKCRSKEYEGVLLASAHWGAFINDVTKAFFVRQWRMDYLTSGCEMIFVDLIPTTPSFQNVPMIFEKSTFPSFKHKFSIFSIY